MDACHCIAFASYSQRKNQLCRYHAGSEGLQTTTDGKPKACSLKSSAKLPSCVHVSGRLPTSVAVQVLDVVDGTGSGDVDTSAVVEAQDGVILGIHGDKLIVNSAWSNPTGKLGQLP